MFELFGKKLRKTKIDMFYSIEHGQKLLIPLFVHLENVLGPVKLYWDICINFFSKLFLRGQNEIT